MLTKSGRRSPPHPRCTRDRALSLQRRHTAGVGDALWDAGSAPAARLIVVFSMWQLVESLRYSTIRGNDRRAGSGRTLAIGRAAEAPPLSADADPVDRSSSTASTFSWPTCCSARPQALNRSPAGRWTTIVRLAAARELAASRDVSRLLEAADGAGLDLLLLKGTALAYTHYEQPHLRPRNDIDLVRQAGRHRRAPKPCCPRSASLAHRSPTPGCGPAQRHYAKTSPAGTSHVDLHWRVVNPLVFAGRPALRRCVGAIGERGFAGAFRPHAGAVRTRLLLACVHRVAHHQDRDEPAVVVGRSPRRVGAVRRGMGSVPRGRPQRRARRRICARGLALAQRVLRDVDSGCRSSRRLARRGTSRPRPFLRMA